ncbi:hypothetical protein SAMN05444162_3075 [Paenibacillaceae bacterium GAS479]|nr:hypothetical protein SAMN05444162_3075 [Paenibacillaceae bacterium GAS479]
MTTKKKESKAELLDTDTWIEMLYQLLNDKEIRKIASVIQPQIQGFTTKNTVKAPPSLLRKKTIDKLKQNKSIVDWMKKWFQPAASKVKEANIDFEQFLYKSKFGESVTFAEAVAQMGIVYPEMFNTHKASIMSNLEAGKHPLDHLTVDKLTPKKALQVKALAWEDSTAVEYYRMLVEKALKSLPVIEGSIKEWVQNKQAIENGEIAHIASTRMDEIRKWPEGEKAVFLQMAFHDSQKVIWTIMEDFITEKSELEKQVKDKEKRLKKLEKQNTEREETEAVWKEKTAEIEKKLLKTELQYTQTLAELQTEIKVLKQRQAVKQEVAAANDLQMPLLVTESDFTLLTRLKADDFVGLIPAGQITTVENMDQFQHVQLARGTQCLFIHSDSFSTKEQFQLDDYARTYQIPFKSVSGNVAAVTRQIIYYLEGAILDEINA